MPHVRERGAHYHREGRVRLVEVEADRIEAGVRGGVLYLVVLQRRDDGALEMTCTCPHYAQYGDGCKHIWATILYVAEFGHVLVTSSPDAEVQAELPDGMQASHVTARPRLQIEPRQHRWQGDTMEGFLTFEYGDLIVDPRTPGNVVLSDDAGVAILRDRELEFSSVARLARAGFRREGGHGAQRTVYRIAHSRMMPAALGLVAEGWDVHIEGRAVRQGRSLSLRVRSGVDWFDVDAETDFGNMHVSFPELLVALRKGQRSLTLADGSLAILPAEWTARLAPLVGFGTVTAKGVRFGTRQAALLDALLAALPDVESDELFERARKELPRFAGVVPLDPPAHFVGHLRPYQREGLGWLDSLGRLGFGGILADDMGLGKTVQALALLERRREAGAGASLVVVPRSLVFNWEEEAARFTPKLRVLVHHGARRKLPPDLSAHHDVVITTYATLRLDVLAMQRVEFDHVILDEAQAIKNPATATAKATRLLRAKHRLAMSGTPIENRLSELWSLFEFTNPGMLGASSAFRAVTKTADSDEDGDDRSTETRAAIARVVGPFILRRTKLQVAPELPPREEQTLWVDLSRTERKLYDELRDHYRDSLRGRIERGGMNRARMHILEAILRLRQAACHPGLVDPSRVSEPSSKLDVLVSRLIEARSEGHKSLVFSQFTSLLAIVRTQLDAEGIPYEYLDGRTKDRKARVDRFQEDAEIPVFLISLKAGGLGLNLTAADYVFLLDPWWNPAVEAQAIDRAHRIGQSRHVFAARLVSRGTIEEKVLELQRGKRELADAIVRADEGVVSKLTREDVEMLLG
ncbi:MAG: helicase, superfamily [Gemmatimonadetes bacterium]|nr:helicase, superfamily [Gemmatimonadota bacterium]